MNVYEKKGKSMYLYTALGDSITAGKGATSPAYAYPSQVVQILQQQKLPATGLILAKPGWTSADLDMAILDNSLQPLAQAQAVSIWVGGDDLVHAAMTVLHGASFEKASANTLRRYTQDLSLLLNQIRKLNHRRLVVCTQYNPFPNSPISTEAVAALNEAIIRTATSVHCSIAPVAEWFAGRQAQLIAGYQTGKLEDVLRLPFAPVHPNNLGHAVIANGLAPLLT